MFSVTSAGLSAGSLITAPNLKALLEYIANAQAQKKATVAAQGIITTLRTSTLMQAEALVSKYYGLQGDGTSLKIQLDPDMGNALAAVSYSYDYRGRMSGEVLHLNMSQFAPDTGSNGTNQHVIENDRIVAHEITHAIMGRNMDWSALPNWFKEGSAEYIAGGAERAHLALNGLSPAQLALLAGQNWTGSSAQYASAYLAIRFLDATTQSGGGIKAIMGHLKAGDSLDTAIAQVSDGAYAGEEDFLQHWHQQGATFIQSLDLSGRTPGAIDGAQTGALVVADQGRASAQPMRGFRILWPYVPPVSLASLRAYGVAAYRQVSTPGLAEQAATAQFSTLG